MTGDGAAVQGAFADARRALDLGGSRDFLTLTLLATLALSIGDYDAAVAAADEAIAVTAGSSTRQLSLALLAAASSFRPRGEERIMRLEGVHHVTAITGDAPRNVDFYARVLGLRLTAKTVNQDDPSVYHLFYGDELARPGADVTFFEYPGAIPGRPGPGMVHRIVWRVASPEALEFWARRLEAEGVSAEREGNALRFADGEGLGHELVVASVADEPLIADHPEVPAEVALQGFEGVRAHSLRPESTAALLEQLMGARRRADRTWELRGAARGGWFALDEPPAERGRQSAGTVHHVAWATTDAEQGAWLQRLQDAGVPNSGIIDRHYFHSLYFREPGGVLFELATEEPGFTVDGPVEELGRRIILPPWLEPQRAAVEARLTPLPDPRAGWPAAARDAR
ncbi:MAG TPA: ring-cleaving dioxygenase [Miltoncostaeaceae bacterium]|nr:ring-cleaving dioxygenase [Miltoncostaeaceae bacterium]